MIQTERSSFGDECAQLRVDRTDCGHPASDAHYPFETFGKSDPAGLLSGSMLREPAAISAVKAVFEF